MFEYKLPEEYLNNIKKFINNEDEYKAFIDSYNDAVTHGFIVNTGKISSKDIKDIFRDAISESPLCEIGFTYKDSITPGKNPLHEAGAYYIQEPGASSVVNNIDINPGDRVLDLCAAPGGKSVQAAIKLNNKGLLVSNEIIPSRPYTEDLVGLPVVNIRYVPLSNTFNNVVKRTFDFVCSLFGIILISPLLLLITILIKTTSKGPLIFSQERIGLHNKPFKMYKFRTMKVQTEEEEKEAWTVKDDPRVTKIGRILRKTSLDELPQLFNILKGEMSIVGPRPERPFFVEKFKEEIPRYMIKHQVRPGLTGWAQVNGLRGDTSIKKRIEYDLYYIENWTFSFDIRIMFLTIFKGFINKNAY